MTVTRFLVKDDEQLNGAYLREASARAHYESILACFPHDAARFHLRIEEEALNSLAKQYVVIEGTIVGYQFAQNCLGTRTLVRTVHHLRYEGDRVLGEITFYGNHYTVVFDWLFKRWYHFNSKIYTS